MIVQTFRFLSAEVRSLHAAAYILAVCTLSSSIIAIVRDRLLAHTFGASVQLDVFTAAFRIPDLLFVLLGAVVSVYVLIPQLAKRSEEEQRAYLDTVAIGFCVLSIVASIAAWVWAPVILSHMYPSGHVADALTTLIHLTRILLLQPIILGFSNICAAITQSRHRFLLYSLSPVVYGLGAIIGIVLFYPHFGLSGMAWGVVLGACFHLCIQIPSIAKDGFVRVPRHFAWKPLWETVSVSLPRAGALSMNQVSLFGLASIAGSLGPGALSVFYFASRLADVPTAIVGASYSVAAYPTLSAAIAQGKKEEFVEHIATAARAILFWSLPITALAIVLRAHIVRAILGSGNFNWTDTRLTAALLGILILALTAQAFLLLLPRGYYAAGKSFIPFVFATGIAVSTIALAYLFSFLAHAPDVMPWVEYLLRLVDVPGTPVTALALGLSTASILGALLFVSHFDRTFGGFIARLEYAFVEAFLAAVVTGCVAYLSLTFLQPLTIMSTLGTIVLHMLVASAAGITSGALIYHILGNREYQEMRITVQDRLWRMGTRVLGNRVLFTAESNEL